jgi:plastocyanin
MTRTLAALTALLLLAGCGGSGKAGTSGLKVTGTVTASGAPGAQTARLEMTDGLRFTPNVVQAKVGSLALTVENSGSIPHNLVFDDASLGKTDTVKGHATATLTVPLTKAGTFRFTCTFHSGMDGQIVVGG